MTGTFNSLDEFKTILEDVLEQKGLVVEPSTTAEDIPSWNSLNHVRLLIRLEQRFGIEFPINEVESVKNVGELLALVDRLKGSL